MDEITNDVTDDEVTNDVTDDVTDDVTNDVTDDFTEARYISEIILNCCLINPPQNITNEMAFTVAFAYLRSRIRNWFGVDISGSSVEFYIVPAVSCVRDIDLMIPTKKLIAVCDGSTFDSMESNVVELYRIGELRNVRMDMFI